MPRIAFPDGFLWGAASAAHQIEGGNVNNDWWEFEHASGTPCTEPSGDACDSWHRWPEDLALLADLGFGAYRFSVEWSRIEPEEGEWSLAALEHYRRQCAAARELGLVPMVTFHHFTTPTWLTRRGGWEAADAPELFARFCQRAVAHLGDLIGWGCTINEPNIVACMGYLVGVFPPAVHDAGRRRAVNDAFCRAHRLAVDVLRSGRGDFPVGLTLSMTDYQAVDGGEERRDRIRRSMEDVYLEAATGDDFVGVQCYTRMRVGPTGAMATEEGVALTQMGYEYWPDALEAVIRRAWDVTAGTPLVVTENGIGTAVDTERISFVSDALAGVSRCLDDGIDVRGYVYWSLLDNFEWVLGYGPTFGLVAVDRQSLERRPKPSAAWLGGVAWGNALEAHD
ncbi:MAG TPA: family 1 glycosylhydrolase [Acidimicrobiales bacterium]|nr:family 1 glycosylhydrolase [Acidimicrobiales bacterium]